MIKRLFIGLSAAALGTLSFGVNEAEARTCGKASYYGPGFVGKAMANGKPFNPNAMTTAHRSLPFGTRLRVTDQSTGKSVTVTVTDRGPFIAGRILDLSQGAFASISPLGKGVTNVCFTRV